MKNKALLPILAGFFVMGFGDIIGTVMIQVKAECAAHAPEDAYYTENQRQVAMAVKVIHAGIVERENYST